MAGLTSC